MAAPVAPLPGLRQAIGPSNPALSKVVVSSYEGERDERGRFVGQGTATFKHGHAYAGAFADGWMHGRGKFSWADGTTFEGDFVRNTIDGNGRYDWADGSYYEGEVRGGIRHGRGCMQVASRRRPRQSFGASMKMAFTSKEEEEAEAEGGPDDDYEEIPGPYYEGDWKLGKRHGEGTLWYGGKDSPSFFKGTWVDGMREGPRGEMVYPSGNRYLGAWQADRRHGKGVMRWLTTEEIYDGDWKEGLQHGAGTHTWLAGGRAEHGATQRLMCNRYVGEWMVGLRHGKGTFYYSNGSRYVGEFQRNLKAGHGVYTFPDGRVYEGPFTDDRMGFNDGSLEEKVATRGPVKIESSRKGTKKKKKKKRKGLPQRTPRAVPLAGTTRNVHLNIGDLMSGLAPKERGGRAPRHRKARDALELGHEADLRALFDAVAEWLAQKGCRFFYRRCWRTGGRVLPQPGPVLAAHARLRHRVAGRPAGVPGAHLFHGQAAVCQLHRRVSAAPRGYRGWRGRRPHRYRGRSPLPRTGRPRARAAAPYPVP